MEQAEIERSSSLRKTMAYVVLVLWAIIALFPIYWILLTSLKTPMDVTSATPKFLFAPTLQNYQVVLGLAKYTGLGETSRVNFLLYFKNSLIIVPSAVILSLVLGLPGSLCYGSLSFQVARELLLFFP